jgi:hypothetical protein
LQEGIPYDKMTGELIPSGIKVLGIFGVARADLAAF